MDYPFFPPSNRSSELTIAVFGDVHGYLRLMLSLCRNWQVANGKHLDAVLICGDLGLFYATSKLDPATKRHAEKDPEELGFARFFGLPEPTERDPVVEATLLGPADDLQTVRCPIIFCHGNHEDHTTLRSLAVGKPLVPVDYYGRIFYLRSGALVTLGDLRIVALGGAPEAPGLANTQLIDKWVSQEAVDEVLTHSGVHVLLTHAPPGPPGVFYPAGSALVHVAIELVQPLYQFYGHVRKQCEPQTFRRCTSYWLNNVCFAERGRQPYPVVPQCMGILTWRSEEDHQFRYVDEPWFAAIHSKNWWPTRQACKK